ncbi:gag polyprotein [Fusarium flagelliforme]|uniref:Gag polyprotein n=1 Tax=Fusarium flagelliforme TaxID=2675880 RepID=A0A395MCN1_9HYPO|nr:gag polyprotein [Fusarium flagelliforme]
MRTGWLAPTCWNCGKKGHQEPECRNPVKTNQKYKPVPEDGQQPDPNYNALKDPEFMEKRQKDNWKHAEYIRQRKQNDPEFRERCRKISEKSRKKNKQNWEPVPETTKEVTTNGKRIAITRKERGPTPEPGSTLTPEEIREGLDKLMDETFSKLPIPQPDGTIKSLQETMGRTDDM